MELVSDNASVMNKMRRSVELWHSNCSSHTGNLLAKDIVDKDINEKLNLIIHQFKLTDLESALLKEGGVKMGSPVDVQ